MLKLFDDTIKQSIDPEQITRFCDLLSEETKIPKTELIKVFNRALESNRVFLPPQEEIVFVETKNGRTDRTVRCDWPMASGGRRGLPCGKPCIIGEMRCSSHLGKVPGERRSRAVNYCHHILQFGDRVGQPCGNLPCTGTELCQRHTIDGKSVETVEEREEPEEKKE